MNSAIDKPTKTSGRGRISLRSIHEELSSLRQRVEDLEDLRELNHAIERNGSKRLNQWGKAKKQLGLS